MTLPLRAAIVDDEPLARARLGRLLAAEADVEVVAEYGDGPTAVAGLRALPVDVLFLDVRMPQVDGFEMLERLPPAQRVRRSCSSPRTPSMRCARSTREAVDYLVKPVAARSAAGRWNGCAMRCRCSRARAAH